MANRSEPALSEPGHTQGLRGREPDQAKVRGFPSGPGAQKINAPFNEAEYMTATGSSLIGLQKQSCARERSIYEEAQPVCRRASDTAPLGWIDATAVMMREFGQMFLDRTAVKAARAPHPCARAVAGVAPSLPSCRQPPDVSACLKTYSVSPTAGFS